MTEPAEPCELVVSSEDGETTLRYLSGGDEVASAVLRTDGDGKALEKLFVDPSHRGKGLARKLVQAAKEHVDGALHIKPRPFGDMPADVESLKKFYKSEGFKETDDKDNMTYEKTAEWRGFFGELNQIWSER